MTEDERLKALEAIGDKLLASQVLPGARLGKAIGALIAVAVRVAVMAIVVCWIVRWLKPLG